MAVSPGLRSSCFVAHCQFKPYVVWAPELAPYRKQYIQTMATFTILLILVMWLIMPAYYGSYADGPEHVPNLSGYLVNRDGSSGALGQTMVDAFENNTAGIGVTHNAHLTWRIIDGSALTDEQVIQRVLDEKVWTAVIGAYEDVLYTRGTN